MRVDAASILLIAYVDVSPRALLRARSVTDSSAPNPDMNTLALTVYSFLGPSVSACTVPTPREAKYRGNARDCEHEPVRLHKSKPDVPGPSRCKSGTSSQGLEFDVRDIPATNDQLWTSDKTSYIPRVRCRLRRNAIHDRDKLIEARPPLVDLTIDRARRIPSPSAV